VEAIWRLAGSTPAGEESPRRVVPDGCIDILFDLERGTSSVIGPMTRAVCVRLAGRVDILGIRFRPGGAAPLLDPAADELRDRAPAIRDVLPGWRPVAELGERLRTVAPDERPRVAASAVARWLVAAPDGDAAVLEAARLARATRGRATVGQLALSIGLTRRTLERRFAAAVGLAPKFVLRVERFREAQRIVDRNPSTPWSTVAFRAGYADQPHLSREVRRLVGVAPTRWAAERAGVAFVQDGSAERP